MPLQPASSCESKRCRRFSSNSSAILIVLSYLFPLYTIFAFFLYYIFCVHVHKMFDVGQINKQKTIKQAKKLVCVPKQ